MLLSKSKTIFLSFVLILTLKITEWKFRRDLHTVKYCRTAALGCGVRIPAKTKTTGGGEGAGSREAFMRNTNTLPPTRQLLADSDTGNIDLF
jgi:hypothetical protein